MPNQSVIVEVVGEGKTDTGGAKPTRKKLPEAPTEGVVPVPMHKLCNSPTSLLVVRRGWPFLPGKNLVQKIRYSRRQACIDRRMGFLHAVVFVIDSEGDNPEEKRDEMGRERDREFPELPTAIGVAHPCIEAWLLADAGAIARAMRLPSPPTLPPDPEGLPAPCKNPARNAKTVLKDCCGGTDPVKAKDAARIAGAIRNLAVVRSACPRGFAPFAVEVETRLLPLFASSAGA